MKLPNKLSALIKIALVDLGKAERSKKYEIDMTEWHIPNSVCKVCFAGAVMAFTCHTDITAWLDPFAFDENSKNAFFALNSARKGSFSGAQGYLPPWKEQLAVKAFEATRVISVPEYNQSNPKPFKLAMRKAARRLEAVGL